MRLALLVPFAAIPVLLMGCTPKEEAAMPPRIGMPNPASVHCTEAGGRSEIRTRADGAQFGVCVFADGRQCEEWALFRDKQCVAPDKV